jgi:hypothetical protein
MQFKVRVEPKGKECDECWDTKEKELASLMQNPQLRERVCDIIRRANAGGENEAEIWQASGEILSLILRERQEATEQAVRVLRESLVGLSDGPNESWDSAIDSALSALDSAVKTLTNSSKPPSEGKV